MADILSTSAALRYTEKELGGPCTENETSPVVTSAPGQLVAQGNGDRVGLIFMNLGGNAAYISLSSSPSSTNGIICQIFGGVITMNVRDDFTLPSRAWYAATAASSTILYVLEITRFKQGEQTS